MRYVYQIALFLLVCAALTAQAQTARQPFSLSKIDAQVIKEFQKAWNISGRGLSSVEGLVLIFANPDGSYTAKALGQTNESRKVTFQWNPQIIAVIHTHPKGYNPEPHDQDLVLADRFGVPIFTLTLGGMFMYDPSTKKISKIKDGLDWLEPSRWTQQQPVAANHIASNR